jgi:hypothetical protein
VRRRSDTGTPVTEDDTGESSRFTGTVNWVDPTSGDDEHDHLGTPEELMRTATLTQ